MLVVSQYHIFESYKTNIYRECLTPGHRFSFDRSLISQWVIFFNKSGVWYSQASLTIEAIYSNLVTYKDVHVGKIPSWGKIPWSIKTVPLKMTVRLPVRAKKVNLMLPIKNYIFQPFYFFTYLLNQPNPFAVSCHLPNPTSLVHA